MALRPSILSRKRGLHQNCHHHRLKARKKFCTSAVCGGGVSLCGVATFL
ncbi:unnamed protein product [Ixodes hexagonus]